MASVYVADSDSSSDTIGTQSQASISGSSSDSPQAHEDFVRDRVAAAMSRSARPVLLTRAGTTPVARSPQHGDTRAFRESMETDPQFSRLIISHPEGKRSDVELEVCKELRRALALRDKYHHEWHNPWDGDEACAGSAFDPWSPPEVGPSDDVFALDNGVFFVYLDGTDHSQPQLQLPGIMEYYEDLATLHRIVMDGPVKTFCYHRLRILEARFNLHVLLNSTEEMQAQKLAPHRDFYNVRKVDTHVHHSSSMNHKHLLRFIKRKLREEGEEEVIVRNNRVHTLAEVFESLNLTSYDLSVDYLDVHAGQTHDLMHRFDKFNLKYNPIGEARLREIFLKTSNHIGGRYLAEITHELFADFDAQKYQMAEYRVSIYGRSYSEWDKLASWFVKHHIYSDNVRWLIQVPRLYAVYRKNGLVDSFGTMIDNIFRPLFEVTQDPASHPNLHIMLQQIVAFDCVDDESKTDARVHLRHPHPAQWTGKHNPPFSYWQYYLWANLQTLNAFRQHRNLNTIAYRPHVGEAGDIKHLDCGFLVADGINHGLTLRKSPCMQYLYYLTQIGIAMSPLSNNSLFLHYGRSPFPVFFARGLNVSLSTDDPLQFHVTKEPLIEEYSIASQVFKLSACDVCEIAYNSVRQSGFEKPVKRHWLGPNCELQGPAGNDITKTNVPNIRTTFRQEVLAVERAFLVETPSRDFEAHIIGKSAAAASTAFPPLDASSPGGDQ